MGSYQNNFSVKLIAAAGIFVLLFLLSGWVFVFFLSDYIKGVINLDDIVTMHKSMTGFIGGAMVMFGAAYDVIWLQLLKRNKPKSGVRISAILMVLGVVLIFTSPHILHYSSEGVLKKKGYAFCPELSSTSFKYSKRIYVLDMAYCKKQ